MIEKQKEQIPIAQAKQKAIDWLMGSGIQSNGGGVYAWYDPIADEYSFLYPEITGYAISIFLYLYETQKEPLFLERAIRAADWILNTAFDPKTKSIPFRLYQQSQASFPYAYSFDTGMILSGLVGLSFVTNQRRYQELAVQLGDWLCSKMLRREGGLYCFWDPKQRIRFLSSDKWSTIPWAYLTKVAQSLIELGELTQGKRYQQIGDEICQWAVQNQLSDGRFPVLPDKNWVVTHPFLYAIEGLYRAGRRLGNTDYVQSAQLALEWLNQQELKCGGIPAELGEHREPYQIRSDVQAQFIRMALLLPEAGIPSQKLKELLECLVGFQSLDEVPSMEGGIQFAIDFESRPLPHANAWCTMFTIQALSLLEEWLETGRLDPEKKAAAIRFFV